MTRCVPKNMIECAPKKISGAGLPFFTACTIEGYHLRKVEALGFLHYLSSYLNRMDTLSIDVKVDLIISTNRDIKTI